MRIASLTFSAIALASLVSAAKVIIQAGILTEVEPAKKLSFAPEAVRVTVDDEVVIMFNGDHSVTQQSKPNSCTPGADVGMTPFDSNVLPKGSSFTIPKSSMKAGQQIFFYCKVGEGAHCKAPNYMQGVIDVVAVGTPTGPLTGTAPAPAPGGAAAGGAAGTSGQTIMIQVGQGGQKFTPSDVNAAPGDTIVYNWASGPHGVVPSDSPGTCTKSTNPALALLDAGAPKSTGTHKFVVPASSKAGDKISFYCPVAQHCATGKMFGTITVTAPGAAGTTSAATAASVPFTGLVAVCIWIAMTFIA